MKLFLYKFSSLILQVALQFPDDIMRDAARVAESLEKATSKRIAILGDTSYGRYFYIIIFAIFYSSSQKHKSVSLAKVQKVVCFPYLTK
jgi:hypothetical protein